MARPQKTGLDYFPLDVDIDQDDKVAIIEAQHGIVGFGIVVKLLMKIYDTGYFYEWTEREQILFSNRVNVNINEVNEIINDCVKWGLFDETLFNEYKILTSKGIQYRYLEAAKRRKEVYLIGEYILIDDKRLEEYKNIVIEYINEVNVNINPQGKSDDVDKSTQSKVKESKVKKSKEDNKELQKNCNADESSEIGFEFNDDDVEIQLARFMIDEMLKIKPDSKVPNKALKSLQRWAKDIDYMIRLDKREPREIAELFRWAQEDNFWCSNIRSPRKLREKWDTLELQRGRCKPKDGNKNLSKLEEMYQKALAEEEGL